MNAGSRASSRGSSGPSPAMRRVVGGHGPARTRTGDHMTNSNEAHASRWSPEVLAYNDFPAIAQRVAEREARREAEGAASRAAYAAMTPQEVEAKLAEQ